MPVIPFIADTAAEAIAQIRAQLGDDAVVVNVRKLPADGVRRLWTKPKIEVVAWGPDPKEPAEDLRVAELKQEIAQIREKLQSVRELPSQTPPPAPPPPAPREPVDQPVSLPPMPRGSWKTGAILESLGLLPLYARRVVDELVMLHGERAPDDLAEELRLARSVLLKFWRPSPVAASPGPQAHIFVGGPGTGKTTCLCKWLTQLLLMEGKPSRVWRLDSRSANTAEWLNIHCEILSVPVERSFDQNTTPDPMETLFFDLPGVPWTDGGAIAELGEQLKSLPAAQVHLVLNAAYETSLLMSQVRAFSVLPISDLIVTHLDEESRWGKLWNLSLGTKYSLRRLAAGQNIPGDFVEASPDRLLLRQFLRK